MSYGYIEINNIAHIIHLPALRNLDHDIGICDLSDV